MRFLSTVFWVLLAVGVVLFAKGNWIDTTLKLWSDIQVDIKVPVLMLITFVLGFLPTWLVMRARSWSFRRRLEALERQRVTAEPGATDTAEPVE
jgi:uncharacterized integral membrane protein